MTSSRADYSSPSLGLPVLPSLVGSRQKSSARRLSDIKKKLSSKLKRKVALFWWPVSISVFNFRLLRLSLLFRRCFLFSLSLCLFPCCSFSLLSFVCRLSGLSSVCSKPLDAFETVQTVLCSRAGHFLCIPEKIFSVFASLIAWHPNHGDRIRQTRRLNHNKISSLFVPSCSLTGFVYQRRFSSRYLQLVACSALRTRPARLLYIENSEITKI